MYILKFHGVHVNISDSLYVCFTGFKWFGSITNLSFRRGSSADKPDANSPSAKFVGGEASNVRSSPDAEPTSVDDMDMSRPRTSSYARSSESYTHMGTLPRLLQRKKDKSGSTVKEKIKKTKEKVGPGLGRSKSQRPAGDHVCNSPLLSMVLSNQHGSRQHSPSEQAGPDPSPGNGHGLPRKGGSLGRSGNRHTLGHSEGDEPRQEQLMSAQDVRSGTTNAAPVSCQDRSRGSPFVPDAGSVSVSPGRARMELPPLPDQLDSMPSQTKASIHKPPSPSPDLMKKTQQKPENQVTKQGKREIPGESVDNVRTGSISSCLLETASSASRGTNSGQDLHRENNATEAVKRWE
ncbi:hypothetical protein DPEC_G00333210 [Dallia pectoralis]|uniref:Uncharacterized protein n=1 Tax=Dallia pectoralis TaxID=75939 RepID=A0ACC2F6C5_DALPE|nr:hypothetical protein DPEC_G00333210 [Dallia pectoralis]